MGSGFSSVVEQYNFPAPQECVFYHSILEFCLKVFLKFLAMDSFATERAEKSCLIMMGEGVCGGLLVFWNWACYC